jgi:glycerol uptake facilitator-like aquaporin
LEHLVVGSLELEGHRTTAMSNNLPSSSSTVSVEMKEGNNSGNHSGDSSDPLDGRQESVDVDPNRPTHTTELLQVAEAAVAKKRQRLAKINEVIQESVVKDNSPEAKLGRKKMMIRAAYGEFMCTLLFYTPIFGAVMNTYTWAPSASGMAAAFVGGFQAIAISYAFSSVSGAHFNSAISFALWLTGKLSNRKLVLYVCMQLSASMVAMCINAAIFHGDLRSAYDAVAVQPVDDQALGRVFSTEFFLTFFLTYIAFTVAFEDAENQKKDNMSFKSISDSRGLTLYASTPQSRTGFAPFSIGLMIFSLTLIGGTSGGAFNPGRIFGPALFSGKWHLLWLYWLGEVCGASCAGLLVNNLHRFGLKSDVITKDEPTAKEVLNGAVGIDGRESSQSFDIPTDQQAFGLNPIVSTSIEL